MFSSGERKREGKRRPQHAQRKKKKENRPPEKRRRRALPENKRRCPGRKRRKITGTSEGKRKKWSLPLLRIPKGEGRKKKVLLKEREKKKKGFCAKVKILDDRGEEATTFYFRGREKESVSRRTASSDSQQIGKEKGLRYHLRREREVLT